MMRAEAQGVLDALHAAQAAFYAGEGGESALRDLLTEDVRWHVPGRNAIAGDHDGIEAVLAYLARRRDVAVLTAGTATIAGEEHRWSTVGLPRLRAARIAEVWLLPLDAENFDRIWTDPTEAEDP